MSEIIKSKTKGNVFIEDLTDPISAATVYVENASSANAFTGSTAGDSSNVTFIGSGTSAKLKLVAAGTSLGTSLSVGGAGMTNVVTLDSLTISTVYGGALLTDAKGKILASKTDGVDAVVAGDVTINIMNGRYSAVYGGGAGYGSVVNGNVTINYGAGHIAGSSDSAKTIYGGGAKGAVVNGDVSININAIAAGKIGSIYAGGNNSVVNGKATVTFSAGQGLYTFSGTVSGGGKGKNARVTGASALVFDGYIGDFKATIKDFDTVTFTGATSVTLTKGQNSTMKSATYNFVITDETRGLTNAMLTLNKKTSLGKVNVSIASTDFMDNGGTVILIASKYFKDATSINVDTFSILNSEGNKIYSGAYELIYNYDKKLGGNVTFVFKGSSLIIDGPVKENITLTDADETMNIVAGAEVFGNIDMGDGDDRLNIQSGAKVYGEIDLGGGNDYLVIQKDALVTGTIDAGTGNDTIVLQQDALVSSEIFLRSGNNLVILEEGSQHTGTLVFEAGSTNTIHVNGGAISSVRGGDATTNNEIILSGIEGLGGGVGVWTTDRRGNTVFQARELVLKGETNDTVVLNKFAEVSGINFGKGEDTLVLNRAYAGDVIFEDGNDAIVAGTDLTLDGKTLKLRGTDNVLVVMNGRTVTITNMTVGSFANGSDFYGGIYLSQNAGLIYNNLQYIQNYVGHLDTTDDVIILAADAVAPARIAEYYTKQTDGVADSVLIVNSLTLVPGAKLDNSTVFAADSIYAFATSVITDSNLTAGTFSVGAGSTVTGGSVNVGALMLEAGAIVTGSRISTGDLDMAAGSTVTGGSLQFNGIANVAGTVGTDLLGSANDDILNVLEGAAFTTNVIDLGGGKDVVKFQSDFSNNALVISNVEKITTAQETLVTIGSAADATKFSIGKNSMLTEVIEQVITVGDWDKAVAFAANYTIVLTGVIDTDVALNGNTVVISASVGEYFARSIALTGTNTFVLGEGVETWYDWQQFSGDTAMLAFNLGANALFAIDGYVPDTDRAQIKMNTTLAQNAALGLGSWIHIQNWSGAFSIDNLTQFSSAPNIHTWDDLEVLAGGKVWGSINMNDDANVVILNDGVVVNGDRDVYDFGTINTGAGDDTLIAGAATINGKIAMGAGDNGLFMDGTIVNKAINQKDSVLEVGDAASNNEIAINNATLNGDVKFSGATNGVINTSTVSGDLSFGDGDDTLALTSVEVGGSLTFGAGDDEVVLDGSTIGGDVLLNGGEFSLVNGTMIDGNLDYVGGFTEVIAGDAAVNGDVLFGTGVNILSVEGVFAAESLVGNAAAQGNSVTVETGASLSLNTGDIELTATGDNLVGVDGGSINMAGDIILDGANNDVVLMNGGSINGLGALEMTGANTLYVEASAFAADSVEMTGAGDNGIVETTGSINVAEAIVMDGGSNTVDTDTSFTAGALFMIADADNTVNTSGSMTLNGFADADGNVIPGVLGMVGTTNELNVAAGDFTADAIGMIGTTNSIDNAGTLTLNGVVSVDGASDGSVWMTGDSSITNSGAFTATNIMMDGGDSSIDNSDTFTAADIAMAGGNNTIANSAAFTATDIAMAGGDNSIANSDAFTAADIAMTSETGGDNSIANSGAFTATNIAMTGDDNSIANSGAFTAADIAMTGETGDNLIAHSSVYAGMAEAAEDFMANGVLQTGTEVFTAGNVVMDSATGSNILANTDVMNLASLTMAADENNGILNVNELNVAGGVALEGNDNRIVTTGILTAGGAVDMTGTGRHSENSLVIDGTFTADSVGMDAYENDILMGSNAVLTAANGIMMNSRSRFSGTDSNEISLAQGFGTIENEELVIDDVNMVIDTTLVGMTGSSNTAVLGLVVNTNGAWDDSTDPASHLVSRATVGAFNVALAATGALMMEGDVNTLDAGYSLISDEEGEILVNGDASIAVGDVTMTGSVNTVDAAINLYAGEQAFVDMNGKNVVVTLGDILMDTDPATGVNTDAVKTNTVTIGLITDTFDAAGDVTTASGEIRNDTGAMTTTAGDISMFGAGAVNTLTIGRNSTVENIAMGNVKGDQVSKSNTLDLDASGTINGNIRLIAETNDVNLQGAGTIENWFDVFGGVNTATIGKDVTVNDVVTFGGVYDQDGIGIDGYELVKNTANTVNVFGTVGGIDTSVSEGAPAGTINASADIIRVNGGVVNGDILTGFGDDRITLRNGASVSGAITMGDASIAAGNTDDNELRVLSGSSVGGAVTMIAGEDNDLRVRGGSSIEGEVMMTSLADDNDLRVSGASRIGASVSMSAFDDNDLDVTDASRIGGAVTMTAAVGDNTADITGASVVDGAFTMNAGDDNYLDVMDASSIEGNVSMTASAGSNDLDIDGASRIGAFLTMNAFGDNELNVLGASVIAGGVSVAAGGSNEIDVQDGSVIEGEAAFVALTGSNDLYIAGASRIGASVSMTAGDANELDMFGSRISGGVSMTAVNDNTAAIETGWDADGNLVGSHVAGDILMDSTTGNNYLTVAGDLSVVPGEMDVLTETTVGGKITMIANDVDGENHLRLEYMTLGGDQVLMQGYLADLTIKTGDWKIFGTTTVDSSTYMDSLHMDSEVNSFTVEEGTVVITGEVEDPALAGYGMAFTGRENTLNINAKGRLIMADTAADMSGPNAPVPYNVDPTTGRNGIFMGWSGTDITDPTDAKYTFTGVTFYGVDPQNGQEVYTFDLSGGTPAEYSAIISDFNDIIVDGKLLTGAVDMLGLENTVMVTGPAESTVAEAYPRPPAGADIAEWATWMNTGFSLDVLLMSTSTLWAESMSFSGQLNTLIVAGGTDASGMYVPPIPVSGASLMVGGAITMGNATVALYDQDGNYVKDGTVMAEGNLIGAGGMDDFTFFKSGAISMTALYTNEAYISGYVFRGYSAFTDISGAEFENQAPFFIKGEVNGSIAQVVADGANVLELELVDVAGNIAQDATATVSRTANTLEIHGTVIAELIDPATGLVFSPEQIVRSSAQDIEQVAHSADELVILHNYINATWTDLGNVAQRTENGSNVIDVVAVNAGNVTMTAAKLDDTVAANNDIAANNVTRLEEVSNFGAITMTAADTNTIDVAGFIRQAVVDSLTFELVTAPAYDLSDIASLTMTGTFNTADLDLVDVAGNIAMTAGVGGNLLTIDGGVVNAYAYLADPADPTSTVEVLPELVYSLVGGGVTQDATDANNSAVLSLTKVTGKLEQNALTDDETVIVGNMLTATTGSIGSVAQLSENGSNTAIFIGIDAGDVTMTAEELVDTVAASNILMAPAASFGNVSNFGNIEMTAADANLIAVMGYMEQAVVVANELISAPDYLLSGIGSLTMTGAANVADLDLVDVAGNITMTAGIGGNDLAIDGALVNGYTYWTDPTNPGTETTVPASVFYSLVGGNITQDAADAANDAALNGVIVTGDIAQTTTSTDATIFADNTLEVFDSSIGNATQTAANGDNAMYVEIAQAGNLAQTAANGGNEMDLDEVDAGDLAQTATDGNNLMLLDEVLAGSLAQTATDGNNNAELIASTLTGAATQTAFSAADTIVANNGFSAYNSTLENVGQTTKNGSNWLVLNTVTAEDIEMTAGALIATQQVLNNLTMSNGTANSLTMDSANGPNDATLTNVDIVTDIDMTAGLIAPRGLNPFYGNNALKIAGTFNDSEGTIGNADWVDANDDDFSTVGGNITMESVYDNNHASLTNTNVAGGIDMSAGWTNELLLTGAVGDVDVSGVATPTVFATTVGDDVAMEAFGTGDFVVDMYGIVTVNLATNTLTMTAAVIDGDVTITGDVNVVTVDANSEITGTLTFGDADTVVNRANDVIIAGSVGGIAAADTNSTAIYQIIILGGTVNTVTTAAGDDIFGVASTLTSITIDAIDLGAGNNQVDLLSTAETLTINSLWATGGSLSIAGVMLGTGSISVALVDTDTATSTGTTVSLLSGVTLTAIGSDGDTITFNTALTLDYVGTVLGGTIVSGLNAVVFDMSGLTAGGAALVDATNLTGWNALAEGGFMMDTTGLGAGTYNIGTFDIASWGAGVSGFSLANGTTLVWDAGSSTYLGTSGLTTYSLSQDASDNVKLTIA